MKKMNLKTIWFNTKRVLYGIMVIVVAMSIPVLSYVELSHTESKKETKEIAKKNNLVKKSTVFLQKES